MCGYSVLVSWREKRFPAPCTTPPASDFPSARIKSHKPLVTPRLDGSSRKHMWIFKDSFFVTLTANTDSSSCISFFDELEITGLMRQVFMNYRSS